MQLSCTVFEISSLILPKVGGHVTMTTPLSGTVCRPWAGICYF